jgi:hypothetical protein
MEESKAMLDAFSRCIWSQAECAESGPPAGILSDRHNDIRPSNIAFSLFQGPTDGAFSLIDFDMTSNIIVNQPKTFFCSFDTFSSLGISRKLMFLSVAQIAATIFMLVRSLKRNSTWIP